MQALPPPPPYHCVKAADAVAAHVKMFITVSGDPAQLGAWLVEVAKHPVWKIEADVKANGVRFARLAVPVEMQYREIGGLIFFAQERHLAVASNTEPPICEADEK